MEKCIIFLLLCLSITWTAQAQNFYGNSFDSPFVSTNWETPSADWTTSGETPPSVGGINTTPFNGSGFAYVQTDGNFTGQRVAILESACLEVSNTIDRIQFYYQMSGSVQSLRLDVSYDDGISYPVTLNTIAGGNFADWTRLNNTSVSQTGSLRFRFVAVFNAGTPSIVALDQVQFFGAMQNEAVVCPSINLTFCENDLTLNNLALESVTYTAANLITSNATISSSKNVNFVAGNQIRLLPGFTAQAGSNFVARIGDCEEVGASLLEFYTRPNPPAPEEVAYFDRFGNGYTRQELELERLNCVEMCNSGVFQLNFSAGFTAPERAVICAVFTEFDRIINTNAADGSVVITVDKTALPGTTAGARTPNLEQVDCGIVSSVIEKILIGQDPNQFEIAHGRLQINTAFDGQWFTDLNNPPTPADNGRLHLETVVLHEALHILGFFSLIGTTNGNVFSRYDTHLFSTLLPNGDFLLEPNLNDPECCDANLLTTLLENLTIGCNYQFRDGNTIIAPVNGNNDDIPNLLSHFNIDCGNNPQYVMHPGVGRIGSNDPTTDALPVRDQITCAELQTLYLIGYNVLAELNARGCAVPATGGCDVVAVDDNYVFELEEGLLNVNLVIADNTNPAAILSNDLYDAASYLNTDFDFETVPGLTITRNGNLLNIQATQAGAFVIPYTLNGCGGTVCDDGVITLTIPNCGTLACEGCDIVAIGDFECFPLIPIPATLYSPEFSLITGGCPEHFRANGCGYIFDAPNPTFPTQNLILILFYIKINCNIYVIDF